MRTDGKGFIKCGKISQDPKGGTKKAIREHKKYVATKVAAIAESLCQNGFVVMDGVMPAPLVAATRKETGALQPAFKPSEIWVGKTATVGAMLEVWHCVRHWALSEALGTV